MTHTASHHGNFEHKARKSLKGNTNTEGKPFIQPFTHLNTTIAINTDRRTDECGQS